MRSMATNTCGGGIDQTAVIGHAPESRDWHPGDPAFAPELGKGVRIEAFVTVDAGLWGPTTVGDRAWLMKHVHVGHDVVIGSDCELSPGTIVGGHAVIGNKVRIGVGALIRPFVNIGDRARIGMGAVVVKDVKPNTIVYGNPAREHDWPANAGPDYGSDPDPRRAAGHSREFGRSIMRMSGGQVAYLTDGSHLYEIVRVMQNFGMRGGRFLAVKDCVTERERIMGDLEAALCRPVLA